MSEDRDSSMVTVLFENAENFGCSVLFNCIQAKSVTTRFCDKQTRSLFSFTEGLLVVNRRCLRKDCSDCCQAKSIRCDKVQPSSARVVRRTLLTCRKKALLLPFQNSLRLLNVLSDSKPGAKNSAKELRCWHFRRNISR
ncbi:hypothetical protein NPIL_506231 [Nephila pilipes]|uniref:Uncharacterized protein n=1 Tax=Nephila pilipes TaxID=299642 RepID=A0A8X6IH19_NEPPI|nr:hypothetical protein NPIL_506231 [Nephila pilipes]